MTTHAVTENTHTAAIQLLEFREKCFRKFIGDIAVHVIALAPWFLGSVDIETCARAEVIGVVFALDFEATWRRVYLISKQDANRKREQSQSRALGKESNNSIRGEVSGYTTAMPFSDALCCAKPFSAQLSPVQVKPER